MLTLIYLYITIFTVYYIILAVNSLKGHKKVRDKYTSKDSNLCVIVYASGEAGSLEYLIRQLKKQTYDNQRYTIYVVLDKVENPPEFIFQTDLGINVVNINNIEPIGKSQAYSIIAEKLSEVPNLNAYVFLDANNYVDSDFLENVNYYLTKYPVFMPAINYIGEDTEMKFWDSVRVSYSRYVTNFIYNARTHLGLTNLLNTDVFVIERDLLNRIGSFDFRDKISEANYTLKLALEGVPVASVDEVKVYRAIENYDLRIPSLSKRINIFWHNWTKAKNIISFEYVSSLLIPNWLVCILCYAFLLSHTYHFGGLKILGLFTAGYYGILVMAVMLALAFSISLFHAGIYSKAYFYLFSYPLYSIGHIIKNFPPIRSVIGFMHNKNRKHQIEKMSADIIVTDGTRDYSCKIELISDDGLAKVKFINNGKVYITKNNHLRMVDAIKELSQKLSDFGLSMKICHSCKYFQQVIDGSTNMVQGNCNCPLSGRVEGDIIPTLIWNTCPNFEKQNVVNLF